MSDVIGMVRPAWNEAPYFAVQWAAREITVLFTQRKTKALSQLCLESLLAWYPDVPIFAVDGASGDDSTLYLRWLAVSHPNVRVWERPNPGGGINTSHGVTMHEALQRITTRYVLLLDSDCIIERGGWLEEMLAAYKTDSKLYAIGTYMEVSRKAFGCGWPADGDAGDMLPYAHPSCSIIDRNKYFELKAEMCDHGAPCIYNMLAASAAGLRVAYYPIDKYVSHLSGASWTEPRTIWPDDHGVKLRPFVTFLVTGEDKCKLLAAQTDNDFDIVILPAPSEHFVVVHYSEPVKFANRSYAVRYGVTGEYVIELPAGAAEVQPEFMRAVKVAAIEQHAPDEMTIGGLRCVRRQFWQRHDCLT